MSFVEKHKAWLLPLLGLGVLGVVYLNLRTLNPEKPAPPADPPGAGAAAAVPPPDAAPPETVPPDASATAPKDGTDIWEDLRPLAVPPVSLTDEARLGEQARMRLDQNLHELPAAAPPPALAAAARPAPVTRNLPAAGTEPPPDPDFVILGPGGPQVWFEGRSYRPGQAIQGRAFTVRRITAGRVELAGPGGPEVRSTNPVARPAAPVRTAPEAP